MIPVWKQFLFVKAKNLVANNWSAWKYVFPNFGFFFQEQSKKQRFINLKYTLT